MISTFFKRAICPNYAGLRSLSNMLTKKEQVQSINLVDHLFKEINTMKESQPLSKKEFIKSKCMNYEEFLAQYGEFAKTNQLKTELVFERMIEGQYKDYLFQSKIIEPGRIC